MTFFSPRDGSLVSYPTTQTTVTCTVTSWTLSRRRPGSAVDFDTFRQNTRRMCTTRGLGEGIDERPLCIDTVARDVCGGVFPLRESPDGRAPGRLYLERKGLRGMLGTRPICFDVKWLGLLSTRLALVFTAVIAETKQSGIFCIPSSPNVRDGSALVDILR